MFKKLLFGALALALSGVASAQGIGMGNGRLLSKTASPQAFGQQRSVKSKLASEQVRNMMWVAPQKADAAGVLSLDKAARQDSKTLWFSYRNGSSLYPLNLNETTLYHLCILVPYGYAGATIDSISALFGTKECMSDLKIWFAGVEYDDEGNYIIPTTPEAADYYFAVDTTQIQGCTAEGSTINIFEDKLALPEPYVIPQDGCFVGYTFTFTGDVKDDDLAFLTMGTDQASGGFFYMSSGQYTGWGQLYGQGYGNLTLAVHCDVTGLESHDIAVGSAIENTGIVGQQGLLSFPIMNNGFDPVNEFTYTVDVNGEVSEPQTYTFADPLPAQNSTTLSFPVIPNQANENYVSVNITEVNGMGNTSSYSSGEGSIFALEERIPRKAVVEVLSSTQDGMAPSNYVGIDRMKAELGSSVIPLVGHFGVYAADGQTVLDDPMQSESYGTVADAFGFQLNQAVFNRVMVGDAYCGVTYPYTVDGEGNIHMLYGATESVNLVDSLYPAEASVTLDAYYINLSKNSIAVEVATQFGISRISSDYGLAFVLTEDGQRGSAESWLQTNYYSQQFADLYEQETGTPFTLLDPFKNADMQGWIDLSPIVEMVHDDVILNIWDGTTGVDGSVPSMVIAGQEQIYSRTFDISGLENIQNKEALKMAVLLINRNNGTIVNADQVALGSGPEPDTTGISDAEASGEGPTEVARYGVNGVRLDAPTKGLNIIKYSDGSVKKVVVK